MYVCASPQYAINRERERERERDESMDDDGSIYIHFFLMNRSHPADVSHIYVPLNVYICNKYK
jgi:hypothetical protein